ncbi:MAG: ABC transporter substrate-binding protein [Oscillospiraceae bacterium]|nr:ABC transporter substrate-binding protein [Oscillospiraceae bacterium]MBQ1767709.1 ABC transporter substrate-binding protein [Oscillospiraceae bacterium]MBQ3985682.1 ABC transporter substrate-binding protein [Oscillospiraceae bacterium]
MKKIIAIVLALTLVFSLAACATGETDTGKKTYSIGICNFVDDASLNQIIENIEARLKAIGEEKGVTFNVKVENCNTDANVLNQIIADFIASDVDLMVGVATPVAMAMQAATEDNKIPVIFAAVSDPLSAGLVDSLDKPGHNISGTSDFLDTNAVMNLIFAQDPDASKIGLLYNVSEDSSATPIAAAKEYLTAKGVSYVERTGTTVDEVMIAAQALIADGVDAIFTPTDNTIMKSELAIYEMLAQAGIPHYTGADSFALNGAFLGYGVDYANLGVETANMVADVLVNGKDISTLAVKTFDNGTATINTETCAALGLDYDTVAATFAPYCTKVQPITTAENFSDLS